MMRLNVPRPRRGALLFPVLLTASVSLSLAACGDDGGNVADGPCTTDADCSAGICQAGACGPAECTDQDPCRGNAPCVEGRCGTLTPDADLDASPDVEPDGSDLPDADAGVDVPDILPDLPPDDAFEVGPDVPPIDYGPLTYEVDPPDNAVGVDPDTVVRVTFNQPMNALRFIPSNLTLTAFGGERYPLTIDYDPETFTLALSLSDAGVTLAPATPHTLRLAEFIGSESGRTLGSTQTSRFSTAGFPGGAFHAALARAYAPVLFLETRDVRIDVPTAWNADGDENPSNNLDNASRTPPGTVYWAVTETPTHYFLTYMLYFVGGEPGAGPQIEHDVVGVQVVARKTGTDVLGRLQAWSTFHRGTLRWWAVENSWYPEGDEVGGSLRGRVDGDTIENNRRPSIFVAASHHTPCLPSITDGRCRPTTSGDNAPFNAETRGLIYRPGDLAEAPGARDDDNLSYGLVSLVDDLWARRNRTVGEDAVFGSTFPYNPPGGEEGGRPGAGAQLPGAFVFANEGDSNGDLPFSFRDDTDNRGQGFWIVDPAYYVPNRGVTLAGTVADVYCFNPFLGIDVRDTLEGCTASTTEPPPL